MDDQKRIEGRVAGTQNVITRWTAEEFERLVDGYLETKATLLIYQRECRSDPERRDILSAQVGRSDRFDPSGRSTCGNLYICSKSLGSDMGRFNFG